jgi:glycerol uptake operon antiterminator
MGKIIAAARNNDELVSATKSKVDIIFMLVPNIEEIENQAKIVHKAGKKLFIHLDLAEGIGNDEYGIRYVKKAGIDGIISTRTNIIKMAKKEGLLTIQRFFIVDSHSVETTLESAKSSKADMVEVMPGVVPKVIERLKNELSAFVVAGGLIETQEEIEDAINAGATAITIGKHEFWK